MTRQQVNQTHQQSKSETPLVSGILQRAAVRRVPDNEVQPTEQAESSTFKQSRFNYDFSQVPVNTNTSGKENKTGMPDRLKAGIENLSGMAMDDVRVHYNSDKPAQLQALAYTQGTDIHVGPGQERHLGHEAWHVVQQKQGRVKPTLQAKGVAINSDRGLETEADVMGTRALREQVQIGRDGRGLSRVGNLYNTASPTVQLVFDTHTGVKRDIAESIYKNYYKGDPPFKPQKGNFGKVSWFAGSGKPYVGGQAQSYDVDIRVRINKDPTRLNDEFFNKAISEGENRLSKNRTIQTDQRDLWAYLGSKLTEYPVAEVDVPIGPMSRSGKGTFISANHVGRLNVALLEPDELRSSIGDESAAEIEKSVNDKELDRANSFTFILETQGEQEPQMTKIETVLTKGMGGIAASSATFKKDKKKAFDGEPTTWAEKLQAKQSIYKFTITVVFADYKTARRAAKWLATNQAWVQNFTNSSLSITGGANWSATSTGSYTKNY
jgi:Domain of unknown function (DUF4157)